MKVYLEPQDWMSQGIKRVAAALTTYRPEGVRVVGDREKADLEIVHVVGWGSFPEGFGDRKHALVQYCLRTTEDGSPARWLDLWREAEVIWSYYDLAAYVGSDDFGFYHAPLGVDGSVFRPVGDGRRPFTIGTSGYVAETECVEECAKAAASVGGAMAHLGPDLGFPSVNCKKGLSDDGVARLWSSCERVAALRRCEGFELPAFEGLACGARPVAFDAPHYRAWLQDSADYIPELSADELVPLLADLFSQPARPVSESERAAVLERCNWQTLAAGFWERAL